MTYMYIQYNCSEPENKLTEWGSPTKDKEMVIFRAFV